MPSSQALPGFLITAPPSVCVPDVIGALAVWIQNPKKKIKKGVIGQGLLSVLVTPLESSSLHVEKTSRIGILMPRVNRAGFVLERD